MALLASQTRQRLASSDEVWGRKCPLPLAGVLDVTEEDWIKVGIEVGGVIGVGVTAFFAMKIQLAVLSVKLDAHVEVIKKIEIQVAKITDVISDQRMLDQRLGHAEQDIRDLQRGEGHVMPFTKSPYEHGGD